MAYLLVRDRSGRLVCRLDLPSEPAVIGRADSAQLRIDDPSVSKRHASIEPAGKEGRFVLNDLGSKNGLRVGQKKCREAEVGPGEEVGIGHVTVTVCGDGPDTLVIPETIPGPRPDETILRTPDRDVQWGQLLNSSERRLLLILLGVALLLSALLIFLPRGERGDGAGRSREEGAAPREEEGKPPAPSPGETTPAEAERIDPVPTPSEVSPALGGAAAQLARALDFGCGPSGCHLAVSSLDFRVRAEDDLGRWWRNLRQVRALAAFDEREGAAFLAPFGSAPPHDQPLPLELTEPARRAARTLEGSRNPFLPPAPAISFRSVDDIPLSELERLRRLWELTFDRAPTPRELRRHADAELQTVLAEARGRPEFWRARARAWLRGTGPFPAHGGFALPAVLQPSSVPLRAEEWSEAVRSELARAGGSLTPVESRRPPLPAADDPEERRYLGWLRDRLAEPARRPSSATELIGAWALLWGEPPTEEMEGWLRHALAAGVQAEDVRWAAIALLVHSSGMPWPAPAVGDMEAWTRSTVRLLRGVELADEAAREIAGSLADGSLPWRVVIEECLLAPVAGTRQRAEPAAPPAVATTAVRVDLLCAFPVRDLFREPERIPRLWSRLENALVQTFPPAEGVDPSALFLAASREREPGELRILSHSALVSDDESDATVRVTDGFLLLPLRWLADRIGEPNPPQVPRAARAWLRERLGVGEPPGRAPDEQPLFEIGGPRLLANRWAATAQRPETRALLLAGREAQRGGAERIAVWLTVPGPPEGKVWEEVMATVELVARPLTEAPLELWLWGPAKEGEGFQPVRLLWEPRSERGWVRREQESSLRFHPRIPSTLQESDTENDDSGPGAKRGERGGR